MRACASGLLRRALSLWFVVAPSSIQVAGASPQLLYSSYLGGAGDQRGYGVAVSPGGHLYVATGTGFARVDPAGKRLVYSTAVPGGAIRSVAVAPSGEVWIAGGGRVSKYAADGRGPLVNIALGDLEDRMALAVDNNGNVWVAGSTTAVGLPTMNPIQPANAGLRDVYIVKLSPSGALLFATYLGGSQQDTAKAIAVDAEGNAYVAGDTLSSNFPTENPLRDRPFDAGLGDVFVAKISASGELLYSTYWGGNGQDMAQAVAVDSQGAFHICGGTNSSDFPVTNDAVQRLYQAGWDGFETSFDPSGKPVTYSTYLGASGVDFCESIAVAPGGDLLLTGETQSTDFPVNDALQQNYGGKGGLAGDAFIALIRPGVREPVFSTFFGGSGGDIGLGAAVKADRTAVITGYTTSADFPTAEAFQPARGGGEDAFVAGLVLPGPRISAEGVVNAASNIGGAVAPGEIVVIYGVDIGPPDLMGLHVDEDGRVARELGGVRVLFDDIPAPLIYVWENQVSAVVPYGIQDRAETRLRIEVDSESSNTVTLPVAAAAPAIFSVDFTGRGQGAILNQDGVTVNSSANPAEKGSVVAIYCTGEGTTTPEVPDGEVILPPALPVPVLPVTAEVGGVPAKIWYAGSAPYMVAGVMQVNVEIPQSAPSGDVPVVIRVGEFATQEGITVAVR